MSSYVSQSLMQGEKVVYTGSVSPWSMLDKLIIVAVCFILGVEGAIVFGIVGIVLLAVLFIELKTTEFAITNKRVIAKFGFIKRSTVELPLHKVEAVQEQSILGRLFNYGSLIITGTGSTPTPIPNVENPHQFRSALLQTSPTG